MIQEKPEFKHTLIPAEGSQIFVRPSVGGDLVAVVVGVLDTLHGGFVGGVCAFTGCVGGGGGVLPVCEPSAEGDGGADGRFRV